MRRLHLSACGPRGSVCAVTRSRGWTQPRHFGEARYYITAAYAQLERGILSERVRAGMQRARKQGQHIGRPHAVNGEWPDYRARLLAGESTQEQAASALGVSRSTICRLLQKGG